MCEWRKRNGRRCGCSSIELIWMGRELCRDHWEKVCELSEKGWTTERIIERYLTRRSSRGSRC